MRQLSADQRGEDVVTLRSAPTGDAVGDAMGSQSSTASLAGYEVRIPDGLWMLATAKDLKTCC